MSLLDQVRKLEQQVVDRLKELEPLTREYEQLRKVAQRLGLTYSPGSAEGDGQAKPSTASGRGRPGADAGKRAAATSAKTRTGRSATRARAAKPAATARGTRSTTSQRSATRATATAASETAAPSRARKRAAGRRAAPARPGQRDNDVLRLVTDNPGITVRELGERLGVDATGLYRVAKRLTDGGRMRKDGPRLYPVDAAAVPSAAREGAGEGASQSPSSGATETPDATTPPTRESSTVGAQSGAAKDA